MKKLLFIAFIWIVEVPSAQPNIQWQKSLGGNLTEAAHAAKQTNDGGYIVAGYTGSNNSGDVMGGYGDGDCWVVKLSATGTLEWQKALGGTSSEAAYSIETTNDGGYILAGSTFSNDGDVTGNHGIKDFWVVKLTSSGSIEWQKALGGSKRDEARSIRQTSDNGYIIAGYSSSSNGDVTFNHGYFDFWVVKLHENGDIQWQKSLGGGSGESYAYSVQQTSDGGYILAGETNASDGDISGYHGSNDFWVVKLDSIGTIEWQRALGGNGIDAAWSIAQTSDGGYIVAGLTASGNNGDVSGVHGGFDTWVVKLSGTGAIQWQKPLGGSENDYGSSVQQTSDGGYIVASITQSNNGNVMGNDGGQDFWVVKLSSSGSILWQKTLGGTDTETVNSVQQTSDGGFIVAGNAYSSDGDLTVNNGKEDFWIVKLHPESTPTNAPQSQPLEIYPNPATQSITIQIPEPETSLDILITDQLGREVARQTIRNGGTIGIAPLPDAVYLVSATTPSGKVFFGKVWKRG